MEPTEELFPNLTVKEFMQTGTHHLARKEECQDVILRTETSEIYVYGLADGQSGKKYGRMGGRAALKCITEYLRNYRISEMRSRYTDELQYEIMRQIRSCLTGLADLLQENVTEFSSTVVVLAVDPQTGEYVCFHLGDGGIIGRKRDGGVDWISAPENGMSARYTWLTTSKQSLAHFRITFGSLLYYNRILMLTDGASAISYGRNITSDAEGLILSAPDPEAITELVSKDAPSDDASLIVIDWDTNPA